MSKFIAIDADAHGLIIAVGSGTRDKLSIDKLIAATDLAQPLTPSTAVLIGERLKQLMKDTKIGAAPALILVGRDRIILKDIKHPPVPPADEPGVVRFQALKEIGDGADDVLIDYLPAPETTSGGEKRATVAFIKKDAFNAIRKMCDTAGLKIAAVMPRPFAAVAVLNRVSSNGDVPPPDPVDGPVAVVLVTEAGGEFTVCRNGFVTFTRNLPSSALANEAAMIAEIRRNLAVAAGQAGSDVQAIYVAEGETKGEGWSGRFRAALGLPVYTFDPLARIPSGVPIPAELHGRFLGPVGMLIARAATGPLPINFASPRQPRRSAESTPQKRRLLLASLLAFVLLFALGAGAYLLNDMADTKVARLRSQILDVEKQTTAGESNAKRLAAIEELNNREVNWLDELYDQSEMFPDNKKMRITQWEGKLLPMPSEKERTAAAATKSTGPKKVGIVKQTLMSENADLPSTYTSSFNRDTRNYAGALKTTGPNAGAKSAAQQFFIDVGLYHRQPADFTRKLNVTLPKLPEPEPVKKDEAAKDDKTKDPETLDENATDEKKSEDKKTDEKKVDEKKTAPVEDPDAEVKK